MASIMTSRPYNNQSKKHVPKKASCSNPIKDRATQGAKHKTPPSSNKNGPPLGMVHDNNCKENHRSTISSNTTNRLLFDYRQKQCLFLLDYCNNNACLLTLAMMKGFDNGFDQSILWQLVYSLSKSIKLAQKFTKEANEILENDIQRSGGGRENIAH